MAVKPNLPRRLAWEVLVDVATEDAYANLLLPAKLARTHVSGQDAAFATELTYGTLRGQEFYDAVIEKAAGRPVSAIDPEPLAAMRMGAHQVLAMRVPDHARSPRPSGSSSARPRARPDSSTPSSAGSPKPIVTRGSSGSPRACRRPGAGRSSTPTPNGSSARSPRRSRATVATPRRSTRRSPPTTPLPRSPSPPCPDSSTGPSRPVSRPRSHPSASTSTTPFPATCPRSPRAAPASRTRARRSSPSPWPT